MGTVHGAAWALDHALVCRHGALIRLGTLSLAHAVIAVRFHVREENQHLVAGTRHVSALAPSGNPGRAAAQGEQGGDQHACIGSLAML